MAGRGTQQQRALQAQAEQAAALDAVKTLITQAQEKSKAFTAATEGFVAYERALDAKEETLATALLACKMTENAAQAELTATVSQAHELKQTSSALKDTRAQRTREVLQADADLDREKTRLIELEDFVQNLRAKYDAALVALPQFKPTLSVREERGMVHP